MNYFQLIFFSFCLDKDHESFEYLVEANNKGEWMWKLMFKYAMGGFIIITATASALSLLFCFSMNGHFNENDVYYTYKLV